MNQKTITQYIKVFFGILLFGCVAWHFESIESMPAQSREPAANQVVMGCTEALNSVVNTQKDASPVLQHCLDILSLGGVLELPAGIFMIENQIKISRAMTLKTKVRYVTSLPCSLDDKECAEFRASSAFNSAQPQGGGLIFVAASNVVIDHIMINGNKAMRLESGDAKECISGNNYRGFNISFNDNSSSRFQNSVSQNALCGTGFLVGGKTRDIKIINNIFAANGAHDQANLWSDGLTEAGESVGSSFIDNHFIDNSNIDLIFGGCQNCEISHNEIRHSHSLSGGSFAGLMIQAWPKNKDGSGGTSGNYSNSQIHSNLIDCGLQKRCGFGLYIGQQAWYNAQVSFGSIHDNKIQNAQLGLNIDQSQGTTLYNNSVQNSGGTFRTGCGVRSMVQYNLGSGLSGLDTSHNQIAMNRTSRDTWRNGCIPNMLDLELIAKVRDAYLALLARQPDDIGEEEFYGQLLARESIRMILVALFNSAEFKNSMPAENTAFITFLYQRLLNRPPDSEGLALQVSALSKQTREQVIQSFLDSKEFQAKHPKLSK